MATLVARVLTGTILVVFGLNAFIPMLPFPPLGEAGQAFLGALLASGFLPIVKGLEVLSGVLILIPRTSPLGVVLVAPLVVAILLFHVLLSPDTIALAAVLGLGWLYLVKSYFANYRSIFAAPATPPITTIDPSR